jgi:WD40 repeat protein/Tfp pilus assembly protein PilF
LFISHSSKDSIQALALQRWLEGNGWAKDDVFIDLYGIGAGEKWRDTLVKANVACEALLFLATPASLDSEECLREVRRAEDDRKEIIVAILRDVSVGDPRLKAYVDRQIVDLSVDPREERIEVEHQSRRHLIDFNRQALNAVHAKLMEWGIAPDSFAWPPKDKPNSAPYPGLDAFDEHSAGIFFGREADVMSGIRELRQIRHRGSPRLLIIQAASGAGKSSFLRAGLWPKLGRTSEFVPLCIVRPAKGVITGHSGIGHGVANWFTQHKRARAAGTIHAELMAGDADAGAARLAKYFAEAVALAAGERTLETTTERPPVRLSPLVAIDQGEELLVTEDAGESNLFLDILGRLLSSPPEGLDPYALITIRADTVDALLQRIPHLGVATPHMIALPPLSPAAYRDVITKPAAVYTRQVKRLEIEPELVQALVGDATGADALPLLAFTLQRIFNDYAPEQKLALAHYVAIGGIGGSIDRALAEAQRQAGAAGKAESLRRLIVPGLATWDPAAGAAKRLVAQEEQLAGGNRSSLAPLANALVASRLLTRGAGTIEVAHEALLRRAPISDWLEDDREFLIWRDRLARERASYETNQRGLLVGRELQIASDWLRLRAEEDIAPADRQFVSASAVEEDRRRTEEEENERRRRAAELQAAQEREKAASAMAAASRRLARRTMTGLVGALLLALVAGGAGFYAYLQQRDAITQADRAVKAQAAAESATKEAQLTQSRFLLGLANQAIKDGDVATGMLLSLEALPDAHSDDPLKRSRPHWGPAAVSLDRAMRALQELATLRGHTDRVVSVVVSPDGTHIVTGSRDKTARVWDAKTGAELAVLAGHTSDVTSLTMSHDGYRIVTGSRDNTARIWDAHTFRELAVLKGHTNDVTSVTVSPDGAYVITDSDDNTAQVWAAKTGAELAVLKGHSDSVTSVTVSPDGRRIVTGSRDNTARIWDAHTFGELAVLKGHTEAITVVTVSPDGRRIVTGSRDNTARIWDANTFRELAVLKGHTKPVTTVALSPDGALIVTGSDDNTARVWDAHNFAEHNVVKGHTEAVTSVAVSPQGRVITSSNDKTGRISNVQSVAEPVLLDGHKEEIFTLAPTPDGNRIVTGSRDKTARVWDANSGAQLVVLQGHSAGIYGVALTPDGTQVITVSEDETVRIWHAKSGVGLAAFKPSAGPIMTVAVTPDGTRLVIGTQKNEARVLDAKTGAEFATLKGHTGVVSSVAVTPDGSLIVTAAYDNTARVWDAKTFRELNVLRGHTGELEAVAVSPDGGRIVTGSRDNTARIWNAKTGAQLAVLKGHTKQILGVAFASDGTSIVTGSADGTARLWDASSGTDWAIFDGGQVVNSVAVMPDGARVVIGGDTKGRIWHLYGAGQRLIDLAKAAAPRCLTPLERQYRFLPLMPPNWCLSMRKWPYQIASALSEGKRLLENGSVEQDQEAEIMFSSLLQLDPGSIKKIDDEWAKAYFSRGKKWLDESKDEEARAQFDLARKHDASAAKRIEEVWTEAYFNRGKNLMDEGKDGEARTHFDLALKLDAGTAKRIEKAWADAYLNRGNKLLNEGKDEEARAQFGLVRKHDADAAKRIEEAWVTAYSNRGKKLLSEGKDEEARAQFDLARKHDAGATKRIEDLWAEAHLSRGEKLLGEGKDEAARAQFDLALKHDAGAANRIAEVWTESGKRLLAAGKDDGAKAQFDLALKQGSTAEPIKEAWIDAYLNRGKKLLDEGKDEEARAQFDLALKQGSTAEPIKEAWIDAYLNRGKKLLGEGKDDGAKAQFVLALKQGATAEPIKEAWIDAYLNRGNKLLGEGKDEEARAQLDLALTHGAAVDRIEEAWAKAYLSRDNTLLDGGKDEEAHAQFDLARRRAVVGEQRADLLEAIAWRWFLHNKPAKGLSDAEQAVSMAPKNGSKYDTRGQIYLALGRIDEGLSDLNLAIQYGYKNDAGTWYGRGRIYELKGNRDLAIAEYRHAISMDPGENEYQKSAMEKARERLSALGAPPVGTEPPQKLER